MQLQSTQLSGLLGALIVSSGLASSIAFADETVEPTNEKVIVVSDEQEGKLVDQDSESRSSSSAGAEETVEVRISMPDGRVIVRREAVRKSSTRRSVSAGATSSRILADGSRISYGRSGVSGGSNSASTKSGSARGGGGGGASSASTGSASSSGAAGSSSSSGSGAAFASSRSSGKSSASGGGSSGSGGSASAQSTDGAATENYARSGVKTFSGVSGSGNTGAAQASGAGSSGGVASNGSFSSSTSAKTPRAVHTGGEARYNQDTAVGGQRVEFHDAGMGAAVVGNTVYFTGVDLVQVDQDFDVVTGTRLGADKVMMEHGRLSTSGIDGLSSWNTGVSRIKLDFQSDTTVQLMMFSQPTSADNPEREQRTWTVRIR